MTLQLTLMRHAKSDWDDPADTDHQRALNARGRAGADALGHWLASEGFTPSLALVSNAERTAETWLRLAATWPDKPQVKFERRLYNGSAETLLAAIKQATAARLLVLAHNPGIGILAEQLCQQPPAHERFYDYPTGATLVLEFAAERWADIGKGRVVDFVIPADLPK